MRPEAMGEVAQEERKARRKGKRKGRGKQELKVKKRWSAGRNKLTDAHLFGSLNHNNVEKARNSFTLCIHPSNHPPNQLLINSANICWIS